MGGDAAVREMVEAVYRSESRRVLATLIRLLGDFDLAEEALHDAFAAALEWWPRRGLPPSLGRGWFQRAASRRSRPCAGVPGSTLRWRSWASGWMRPVAVAMRDGRDGPLAGLELIDAILERGDLADYHLAHAARADLCRRLGRTAEAKASYEQALSLAKQEPERQFLERRLAELSV
jgi:predicted RNA polymerase sigma factor